MKTIPALSVRQPWAYAIVYLGKDIENRTRRFGYRGPLLIHAGKSGSRAEYAGTIKWIRENAGRRKLPDYLDMQRGGIVGVVDVIDCVTSHSSPWFAGPYGLVLANPRSLPFVPYKGQLGSFK